MEKTVSSQIKLFGQVDKFILSFEFFRDNKIFDYLIKTKIFIAQENLSNDNLHITGNKNYAELYKVTENIFKKFFGLDGVYFALLYHWGHIMQFKKSEAKKLLSDCLKILGSDI